MVIVVAALGFGWTAPVVAQAQVERPAWGWEALAERLTGWAAGALSAVAGARTDAPPPEDDSDVLALDGGEQTSPDSLTTETKAYPGFDPNG